MADYSQICEDRDRVLMGIDDQISFIFKCTYHMTYVYMGVSENRGTPKSSILIGFSIINHPFWGTPIFGNTHI